MHSVSFLPITAGLAQLDNLKLASALFVAILDHGGSDSMVWYGTPYSDYSLLTITTYGLTKRNIVCHSTGMCFIAAAIAIFVFV